MKRNKKRQIISVIVAVLLILGMVIPPVLMSLNGFFG